MRVRRASRANLALLLVAGCARPNAAPSNPEAAAAPSSGPRQAASASPSPVPSTPPSASAGPPPPSASVKAPVPPRSTLLPKGSEKVPYEALQKIVLETSGFSNRFELIEARQVHFPRADRIVVMLKIEPQICAFGVIEPSTGNASYVPGFDYDCKDVSFVADDDFNGDGVPDFQYLLVVPSNRYPADVVEGDVYLSVRDQETYCYSPRLQLLTSAGWTRSILPEVRALSEREGPSVFDCKAGN